MSIIKRASLICKRVTELTLPVLIRGNTNVQLVVSCLHQCDKVQNVKRGKRQMCIKVCELIHMAGVAFALKIENRGLFY